VCCWGGRGGGQPETVVAAESFSKAEMVSTARISGMIGRANRPLRSDFAKNPPERAKT
jgi:hypothetical protein